MHSNLHSHKKSNDKRKEPFDIDTRHICENYTNVNIFLFDLC